MYQSTQFPVRLSGTLDGDFVFSHVENGENIYFNFIKTINKNGKVNRIPITVPKSIFNISSKDLINRYVEFSGYIISVTIQNIMRFNVRVCTPIIVTPKREKDLNLVYVNGRINKKFGIRTTPTGKSIYDFLVSTKDPYAGIISYIPAIAWNNNALLISDCLKVGDEVEITGIINSRQYVKKREDGTTYTRTAYEISTNSISMTK